MKYMSISVTISQKYPDMNRAHFYFSDDKAGIEIEHTVTYEDGMKELRQLEKKLNRAAQLTINRYNTDICYKELSGFFGE